MPQKQQEALEEPAWLEVDYFRHEHSSMIVISYINSSLHHAGVTLSLD